MTDRYVDPTSGNNANAGTLASPWKDLGYALTGSRCTEGDTIYLMAGDYTNIYVDKVTAGQNITMAFTANSGLPITITPYSGAIIEIAMPSNAGAFLINYAGYYIKWVGVGFTNPNNLNITYVLNRSGGGYSPKMEFEDCYINKGTSTSQFISLTTTTDATARTNTITFKRCKIPSHNVYAVYFSDQSRDMFYCNFESCDIEIAGSTTGWFQIPQNTVLSLINNNIKLMATIKPIYFTATANQPAIIKNNRFDRSTYYDSANKRPSLIATADNAETYFAADVANRWLVKNNLYWDSYETASLSTSAGSFFNSSYEGMQKQMVIPYTNRAIDLSAVNGYGDSAALPTKAMLLSGGKPVIGGQGWTTSSDTGCYPNTSGTPANYIRPNTLCFFGDSISSATMRQAWFNSRGSGITAQTRGDGSGIGAIGGIGYGELMTLIDWNYKNIFPEWGVLSIGVNNVAGAGSPIGITNQRMADQIIELMRKIQSYGGKPVWLGMPSLKGSEGGVTTPQAVNAIVEPVCKSNGWAYGNIINYMIERNASWQTVYYTDYTNDVHPNDEGQKVMAEYALKLINEAKAAGELYRQGVRLPNVPTFGTYIR